MILSDAHIKWAVQAGKVKVSPWDPSLVQPSSLDVRLGGQFRVFDTHNHAIIDPGAEQPDLTRLIDTHGGTFVLHPGEFALGCTLETITLPDNLCAHLDGKSTLGRLGLLTHATAGFIDPGFEGQVTLELSNVASLPIKLTPGMRIGQLTFHRLTGPCERPYGSEGLGSHYQGQTGPTASRTGAKT